MRKLISIMLAFLLLFGTVLAETGLSACEIARQMAQVILEMEEVKSAPLDKTPNRAIWMDQRTGAKCALTVFEDAAAAEEAAVERGTPDTTVRAAGCCLLEIDSDLSLENINLYCQVLADVLDIELNEETPDYILNVNTKKFHYPDCISVGEMKQSNKQSYNGEKETLIQKGYEACKRCKP